TFAGVPRPLAAAAEEERNRTMSMIHVWAAMILLFVLLLAPIVTFLSWGWEVRRRDIVDGFTDAAIQSYFRAFHPHAPQEEKRGLQERFNDYYRSQFGRSRFLPPLALLAS